MQFAKTNPRKSLPISSVRSSTFRARGVMATYNISMGRLSAGIGGGYDRRKYIAAPGTVLALANGVIDENYWLAGYLNDHLDEHSGVRADLYANWFRSGSSFTGDANAYGATASYYRNLSRHLSANAALGIEAIDRDSPLSDDWVASALVGVRWAPLYGKISLLAELPVHFQAYLWGGGGVANFNRQSIVYCQGGVNRADGTCGNWLTDAKVSWLASAAFGMRFFTHQGGGIVVEVRDYVFPDSYLINIDRSVAEAGGKTGDPSPNPGLTNLVLVDLGYSFIF